MTAQPATLLPYTDLRIVSGELQARFREDAYRRFLGELATRDLLDELEHLRYLAVELAGTPSRAVAEVGIRQLTDELARRQQLIARGDPIAPTWPRRRTDIPARIAAVKAAWPVARMVTELMGCQLKPYGRERLKGLCPLHEERTPSFTVFPAEARAHCFGCGRGGDVLALAGLYFGHTRFIDQLECLERFAGIDGRDRGA